MMTNESSPKFTIGLIQMRCAADLDANLESAVAGIRVAAQRGAQIICLPELFRTPYFCQSEDIGNFDLAETIPGLGSQILSQVAKETKTVILASLFERRAAGVYHNTVAVLDADGSLLGIYRKMHIPDDPLYYEKFYFTPGDTGFRAFDTHYGRIGVLICWDQWFPEAARLTAMQGAEILFYPTAIGWHPREKEQHGTNQHEAWELIQRSHAVANGVYVASVNRVGLESSTGGDIEFWGASFVCDPFGTILERAPQAEEDVLVAHCDRKNLEDVRRNWPFLRDRRIDAYGGLTERLLD